MGNVGHVRQMRQVEQIVIVVTAVVVGVDRVVVGGMVIKVCIFTGLQQDITIPLHHDSVLTVDDHAAAASKRSPSHLKKLCRWIRREHEILVRSDKHVDQGECSGQNHPVRDDR